MAKSQPAFIQKQHEFVAHIREPKENPCPDDVDDRRMAVYRRLFYNNVENFISNGFPVLRKLYSPNGWHQLVRDFFARHQSQTPLFPAIAQEFLTYLQNERTPQPEDPPFLLELAHYEWVELAVSIAEEEPNWEVIDIHGDLMNGVPALSPLAWLLTYRYPVHQIGPEFIPQSPGETATYLMVYRDLQDKVGFLELNPVTACLVSLIQEQSARTGLELLQTIAEELAHPQPDTVIRGGEQILSQLKSSDILLGIYLEPSRHD
jgi:hypothetical protein